MTRAEKKKFVIKALTQVQYEVLVRQSQALLDHEWNQYNTASAVIKRVGIVKNQIYFGRFPIDMSAAMSTVLTEKEEKFKELIAKFEEDSKTKSREEHA
jgi:hypothetical protein